MKKLLMTSALTLLTTHLAEASYPAGTQLLCTGPAGLTLGLLAGDQAGEQGIIGGTKQSGVLNISSSGLHVENEAVVLESHGYSTRCGRESRTLVKFPGGSFGVIQVKNNACGEEHYVSYFLNVDATHTAYIPLGCQVGAQ